MSPNNSVDPDHRRVIGGNDDLNQLDACYVGQIVRGCDPGFPSWEAGLLSSYIHNPQPGAGKWPAENKSALFFFVARHFLASQIECHPRRGVRTGESHMTSAVDDRAVKKPATDSCARHTSPLGRP